MSKSKRLVPRMPTEKDRLESKESRDERAHELVEMLRPLLVGFRPSQVAFAFGYIMFDMGAAAARLHEVEGLLEELEVPADGGTGKPN